MDLNTKHLNQETCFSFEDADAERIISQESLFDHPPQENATVSLENEKSKMSYLEKKEIRLKWHGIALSEYWRSKQIPRGLRVNKKPTLGNQDPEFKSKWEKILNKCSMDLTLLIIEQTKKEAEKVKTELQEIKTTLKTKMNKPDFTTMESAFKEELMKFEEELKAYKIKKYQRDSEDYKRGTVYNWTSGALYARRPRARRQRHPRATQYEGTRPGSRKDLLLTSEDGTSDQSHTGASSAEEAFLEDDRSGRRKRGGARGRGARPPPGEMVNRETRSFRTRMESGR